MGGTVLALAPPGKGNVARFAGWVGTGVMTHLGLTPPGYGNVARFAGCFRTDVTANLGLTPPGYGNVARFAGLVAAARGRSEVARYGFNPG